MLISSLFTFFIAKLKNLPSLFIYQEKWNWTSAKEGAFKIENMMFETLLKKEKWHYSVHKGSFFKMCIFPVLDLF